MKKLTRDDLRKLIVAEAKRLHEMPNASGTGERIERYYDESIDLLDQAIASLQNLHSAMNSKSRADDSMDVDALSNVEDLYMRVDEIQAELRGLQTRIFNDEVTS